MGFLLRQGKLLYEEQYLPPPPLPPPIKAKSDMENYFSPPGDAALSLVPPSAPPPTDTSSGLDPNTIPRPSLTRKAKVLYDYDAADKNELSLLADEVSVRAYAWDLDD